MITKKQALEIMENFHADTLTRISDVDFAISVAAGTGNSSLSFFYPKKNAMKLKTKLRAGGFYLETVTFRSMPTQEHITVIWDSSILAEMERSVEVE